MNRSGRDKPTSNAKLKFRHLNFEPLLPRELFASDLALETPGNLASVLDGPDTRGARVQQVLLGSSTSSLGTPYRNGVPALVGPNQLQSYSWSRIDTISFIFDEQVQVNSSHLQLLGKNSPSVASFNYDSQSSKAVWKFSTPLSSGKYLLKLSDRITDPASNRLDGEWLDGTSQVSGNGLPGGELNFRFDINVGDVDIDGAITVRDFAMVESNFGANSNLRFDVNMSGATDAADSAIVSSVFGDSLSVGAPNETLVVKSMFSTNKANPRFAVIGTDQQGNSTLSVINADDGQILTTRMLDRAFRYLDLELLFSNTNLESIAILGVHRATGEVRLWMHSPSLSGEITSMSFGKSWIPLDMEVFYSSTQTPRIAILGTQNTKPYANRIWLADPQALRSTGSISLGSNFEAQKFVVTPGTGSTPAMISVLGLVSSNRTMRVKTFNSATFALVTNIALTGNSILDFKQVFDTNRNEPVLLALSYPSNGLAEIEVRTLQGTLRRKLSLQTEGTPIGLTVWSRSTSTPVQFALLTEVGPQHEGVVLTGDLLTAQIPRKISFGSGFNNSSLFTLALASADDVALSVTQVSPELGAARIKMRSARNGNSYRTIPTRSYPQTSDFFDQNRVHLHAPLSEVDERLGVARSWFETYESEHAAELLSAMGVKAFTRHVKTGDEDPWWPSEFPSDGSGTSLYAPARNNQGIALDAGQSLPQLYANEALANDMPMIGYYFDATEQNLALAHPEWVCKNYAGAQLTPHPTKGNYLDVTGEYGDVVKNRLLEIANMGARGIYLDFRHLPAGGCWGTQLATDFQATYGIPAPPLGSSAQYVKFMEFQAERVTQTLQGWKDAVAAQYPYFHFVISVTSVPGLTRIDMNSGLVVIDSPKSEFNLATQRGQNNSVFFNNPSLYEPDADLRMAFGWELLREVASKSLPHIWHAFTPNREQLLSFVSAVNTYGMIAAVQILGEYLQPGNQVAGLASGDDVIAAIDLGNKISPHISGTEPTRWLAVHFAEHARNSFGTNSKLAWEKVLLPAVAAFQAGHELGRPVSVINDDILTNGIPDGFRALYLPDTANLSTVQLANIDAFRNRGGVILINDGHLQWGQAASYRQGVDQIVNAIGPVPSQVEFLGLPLRVHAVAHSQSNPDSDGRIVLAITNDFTYVQGSTFYEPIPINQINPTPPPVPAGVRAVLRLADWPQLTAPNTEIIAVNALTLTRLPIVRTTSTLEIVFPEFAQTSWVVIESIPTGSAARLTLANREFLVGEHRTNTVLPQDVNADGQVSPFDALVVINALNAGRFASVRSGEGQAAANLFLDVNGDNQLTPLDALLVINYLSRNRPGACEGEANGDWQTLAAPPIESSSAKSIRNVQHPEPEYLATPVKSEVLSPRLKRLKPG